MSVRRISKYFPGGNSGPFGCRGKPIEAVDGVSFDRDAGQTLGLVGESGYGKSITGRVISKLLEPMSGEISFNGCVSPDPELDSSELDFSGTRLLGNSTSRCGHKWSNFSWICRRISAVTLCLSRTNYLFIAHDLSVFWFIADRGAVMTPGRNMETTDRDTLYSKQFHPYAYATVTAEPVPDPRKEKRRVLILLRGDVPSPTDPPF